jgi:hypothetical protein
MQHRYAQVTEVSLHAVHVYMKTGRLFDTESPNVFALLLTGYRYFVAWSPQYSKLSVIRIKEAKDSPKRQKT